MTCTLINNGILCLGNINFSCPYCKKQYSDDKDKYLNRCNKNVSGSTKIHCECGQTFGMTYNYKGEAIGFKIK